jgi:hypothetical protein
MRRALRARLRQGATLAQTMMIRSASSAKRAMSPSPATAPTSLTIRRRKCCLSSPTASRTNRAAAVLSRQSTTLAILLMAIRQEPTGARRSRTAASRSRSYYLAVPTDSWYQSHIAPILSDVGPALQACASPGLFYDAAIGSDLGAALSALFAAVTQSGHLTQ